MLISMLNEDAFFQNPSFKSLMKIANYFIFRITIIIFAQLEDKIKYLFLKTP